MGNTKSIVILAILMHLHALSLSPISGNFGAIVWVFLESCNCSNMFFISFQHQWKLVELTIQKFVGYDSAYPRSDPRGPRVINPGSGWDLLCIRREFRTNSGELLPHHQKTKRIPDGVRNGNMKKLRYTHICYTREMQRFIYNFHTCVMM